MFKMPCRAIQLEYVANLALSEVGTSIVQLCKLCPRQSHHSYDNNRFEESAEIHLTDPDFASSVSALADRGHGRNQDASPPLQ